MRTALRKMIGYYKPYRKVFFADMFFALAEAGAVLVLPVLVRYITQDVIYRPMEEALHTIAVLGIVMAGLVAVECYCKFFISNYGHVMGAKMEYDMRAEIFAHYQKLSFSFYDDQKVGQLMSRITSDLFDITELLHHGPENLVISLIKIIGAFIILMVISPWLTLAAFALVPVMFVYAYYFNRKMKRAFRRNREQIAEINAQIEDNLSGIRVVKSFANEGIEKKKFRRGNDGFLRAKKDSYLYMGGYQAGLGAFTMLIQIVVLVAGAVLITRGMVDVTDLVTFLLYINIFTEPIRTLIDFTEQFQNGYTGFERFMEILSIQPDIKDRPGAREIHDVKGAIEFKDVAFHYQDNEEMVLNHVNLSVEAGSYIALVGSSGAGKSTLCSLIPRFYEVTEGSICIDGTDIRDIKLKSLRDHIGLCSRTCISLWGQSMTISAMAGRGLPAGKSYRRQKMRTPMSLSCRCRTATRQTSDSGASNCPEDRSSVFPSRGYFSKTRPY